METALPCNSGGHRSLAHFEKDFGRFPEKAEMEIKIEQGDHPQSLSISVLLHCSNIGDRHGEKTKSISEFATRAKGRLPAC
jgi:hypothetical protein